MNDIWKNIGDFFKKHEPEILTGTGLAGFIFSIIASAHATKKAVKKVEELKATSDKPLTKKEIFKACWKYYIPTTLSTIASFTSVVCGNRVAQKRTLALTAACSMAETALQEYCEKTKEIVGEKQEQQIHESISKDRIAKSYEEGSKNVVIVGDGDSLFYEPLSGRYFKTNWNKLLSAANVLNATCLGSFEGVITCTDWFDSIGLERTETSDYIGWNVKNGPKSLISITIDSSLTPDNTPCGSIYYVNRPTKLAF